MSGNVELAGIRDRMTIAVLGGYWRDQRFDFTSGSLDYRGVHEIHKADEADTGWQIWKLTYSGDNVTRIEGPLTGSWTGRAALDWA